MNSIAHARNDGNLYMMLKDKGVNVDFNPEKHDEIGEGYGDDNVLNKLPPEDREEKLKTQPVYSEEKNKYNEY